MKVINIKNNKVSNNPLIIDNITVFSDAEIRESSVREYSIIGERSRVRTSQLGTHTRIDRDNLLMNTIFGDYSYTGPFDMIFNSCIGKFTSISYGVTIGPPEHNYHRMSMHPFIYDKFYDVFDDESLLTNDKFDEPLNIGNDVWIGCNASVLRGVNIGNGAVIGANTLVNRDVPPYAIVVGNPGQIVKYRFSAEIIENLLAIKWWDWSIDKIRKHRDLFVDDLKIEALKELT